MSSLPKQASSNDKRVTEFFDNYFTEKLKFSYLMKLMLL